MSSAPSTIVLLHGLARTPLSMLRLRADLEDAGLVAHSVGYRSRRRSLRGLAADLAAALQERGLAGGGAQLGFVGHSLGGLVLRALPLVLPGFRCGRSVLLGTPLSGSIIAERAGSHVALRALFGPVLAELAPGAVRLLPRVPGPYAVIAGSTWTPLLPAAHLLRRFAPGEPSDSTVRVVETVAEDAEDHLVVRAVHTLLPESVEVRSQVMSYLRSGAFTR